MSKYENYDFIPMETLARKLNVSEVNIGFRFRLLQTSGIGIDDFEKIGLTHYALPKKKNEEFELRYKKFHEEAFELIPLAKGTLKDLLKIKGLEEYKNGKKTTPVYRIINKFNGEVMNCDIVAFPSGSHELELVGILIKKEVNKCTMN